MSDELPPLWALDKAAKAVGHCGWSSAKVLALGSETRSIIAHARTIAQYEQPPVDEDEISTRKILLAFYANGGGELNVDDNTSRQFQAALAQFKRELEARK